MNYSELDKPNPPHNLMRNAFVGWSTDKINELLEEHRTEAKCLNMELETMEWELEHRSKV